MKRLLTMLLSLFVAITNNIGYQAQGDMEFARGAYYTIDEGRPPDYRDIYGTNPVASKELACHPTVFLGDGKYLTYPQNGTTYKQGMWIVNHEKMKFDDLPTTDTYTFEDGVNIIMPFTGVLKTSSKTNNGHTMVVWCEVDGTTYRIVFNNMERWYCCMSKPQADTANELGEPVWVHTCEELLGTQFKQGSVLGVAQKGTTATVSTSSGGSATWKDLYNH